MICSTGGRCSLALLATDIEILTAEEWVTCKELCDILKPCEEVLKEMSGEKKYITASQIDNTHNPRIKIFSKKDNCESN